jgi:hypothetical protein
LAKLAKDLREFIALLSSHGAGVSGVNFDTVWQRRVEDEMDGLLVSFIGLPELLANKQASDRAKDLADIEALTRPAD